MLAKSHIDNNKYVTKEHPVISLVRKKGVEHAFLIVETLDDEDTIQLVQVDLFVDKNKPFLNSSGYYLAGTSKIKPELVQLSDLERYQKKGYFYQSFECFEEECDNLIKDVLQDSKREDISYSSMGDGTIYKLSSSNLSKEQHNCTTYFTNLFRKHLKVEVGNSWINFIIALPSDLVKGDDKTIPCSIL